MQGRSIDKLMKYVYHMQLRDTNKKAFQVRVGQGEIEYGRLITQLQKLKYNRALTRQHHRAGRRRSRRRAPQAAAAAGELAVI